MSISYRRCAECGHLLPCAFTGARWLCAIDWIAAGYVLPDCLQPFDRGSDAT